MLFSETSFADAKEYTCRRKLFYTWTQVLAGGKKSTKEVFFKAVEETGSYKDYIKTRMMRVTNKLEEDALNACRGTHEGAELCLLEKLEQSDENLYELPFEKRQKLIERIRRRCSKNSGKCISSRVSRVRCAEVGSDLYDGDDSDE